MARLLTALLVLTAITGCAGGQHYADCKFYDCKHHAIIAALAYKDEGAEFAYGLSRSTFHVQAVIRHPDGTETWLEDGGDRAFAGKKQDSWRRVITYLSIEEVLMWWMDCDLIDSQRNRARRYELTKKLGGVE